MVMGLAKITFTAAFRKSPAGFGCEITIHYQPPSLKLWRGALAK
jgi:hypothetical protein